MPGPVGKREDELRYPRRDDGIQTTKVDLDALITADVEAPDPPVYVDKETGELKWEWHPTAVQMYLSLQSSGQAIFYEPSDWMLAYVLCETLSRELKPQPIVITNEDGSTEIEWTKVPIKGASLTAFLKGMTNLMVTEGDRRRLRIELERKKATDAIAGGDGTVVSISKSREARLG